MRIVAEKDKTTRPAAVTFTGRLLSLQSVGLVILAILAAPEPPIANHEWRELWRAGLYITLGFLSAWSGLGLLKLRPPSWNLAMLVQGTALLHALVLYRAGERPVYMYLQMLLAILIVVNLNQSTLRASFPTEIIETQETPSEPH
ncbi:MAG: hypothetical protein KF698_08120 [Anaerolineales bacterium]|nr:hypothetical protein [Anaerolineales bacterium]